jgi:PAS domain S-box-containing protein
MPVNYLFRAEAQGDLQRLRQAYRKTGLFHSQEGFYLRHQKDGVWVPVNLTVTRLHAEPRTLGLITARDISERREAQAQLKKTEAELRQVLASVSDSIWSVQIDEQGRWQAGYCSPVAEQITGWPASRYHGGPDARLQVIHPADQPGVRQALSRLQTGASEHEELEYRIERPDGRCRWVRESILARRKTPGGTLRLDAILTDITDRKTEENLLKARRSVLELIARGAPLTEVLERLVRAIEEQSPDSRAAILLSRREELQLRVGAVLQSQPELHQALNELSLKSHEFAELLSAGPGQDSAIASRLVAFGSPYGFKGCWCRPILASGADSGPRLLGLLTVFTERAGQPDAQSCHLLGLAAQLGAIAIERRQAEDTIRVSEARYRSLIENLEQCVFLKDADFRFVAVNPPFCRAIGRSEAEILGRTDFDFYPAELAEKFREDDRQVLLHNKRIDAEEQSMFGGQRRFVRIVKTPVREEQGGIEGVLGIFWDVTEQRSLESQLRQAQKMEAVGQLAGGVAHDFNNLLTAILGNLSLLSTSLNLNGAACEILHSAETAALRAANLTSQLVGLARRTLLRPEAASLNSLVAEVVSLLKRTIDPRITLEVREDPELWPVLADTGLINQVLMNLCINARDAMPDGGQLLLQTGNAILGPESVRNQLNARPGEFVCLRVRDTGAGMTEEVRGHLFEPFFTTKGPGKGTGLGLATVFGIVQQHQGWIVCDSEPGHGTAFRVYLPRLATAEVNAGASEQGQDTAEKPGTETVLFVDDEPALRSLGRTILERSGNKVVLAEDGVEALELFRKQRGRIDLVILDLTMPRLSGRDTFRALRAIDQEVCVLFASGYSREQLSAEERERSDGFVTKPYHPCELVKRVREILDRRATNHI